jgi:hypothetical protein
MDPATIDIVAPMVVAIIFTLTVAGVILLKPISNKLGNLLEAMAEEKREPRAVEELTHIRELLETMNGRLSLLEERQDFTDALLNDPERRARRLTGGKEEG